MAEYNWPYPDEFGQTETVDSDILVLGGGLAGCFAAIAAARKGKKVVLVEKGATKRSGAAGTGFDHWESACTNPCSQVTPEEIANAYVDEQDHYSNGIAHYIECREVYFRKSQGDDEDSSGVYNTYSQETTINVGEAEVTCKGDSDAYELAIWQQGGYSYSISLQIGISLEELQAMIETVED